MRTGKVVEQAASAVCDSANTSEPDLYLSIPLLFPCYSAAIPLRVPLLFRCLVAQRNSARDLRYFNGLLAFEPGFVPAEEPFCRDFFRGPGKFPLQQRKSACRIRWRGHRGPADRIEHRWFLPPAADSAPGGGGSGPSRHDDCSRVDQPPCACQFG